MYDQKPNIFEIIRFVCENDSAVAGEVRDLLKEHGFENLDEVNDRVAVDLLKILERMVSRLEKLISETGSTEEQKEQVKNLRISLEYFKSPKLGEKEL